MSPSNDVWQDAAQAMPFGVEFCNEQGLLKYAGTGLVQAGNREFYRAGPGAWPIERSGESWTPYFRA